MKSEPTYRFYRRCFHIARVLAKALYFYKVEGQENVPPGAAVVCSIHSSYSDPVFVSFALGIDHYVHYIAKIELFSVPVLKWLIRNLGAISVDRSRSDINTIKASLGYLKKGEKVGIFPEARRVTTDEEASAKNGAVKIAERAGVPIVPVYVPRKKKLFRRVRLVVGAPYYIEKQETKRTREEYTQLVDSLMETIKALER